METVESLVKCTIKPLLIMQPIPNEGMKAKEMILPIIMECFRWQTSFCLDYSLEVAGMEMAYVFQHLKKFCFKFYGIYIASNHRYGDVLRKLSKF